MSKYRGFDLFVGKTVEEMELDGTPSGNTLALRANTNAENQDFRTWIDLLLDTPEVSAAFRIASLADRFSLRGIAINSEIPNNLGLDGNDPIYSENGIFNSSSSTFDQPNSRFTPAGVQFDSDKDTVHLNFETRSTYLTPSGAPLPAPDAQIVFVHELSHALNRVFIDSGAISFGRYTPKFVPNVLTTDSINSCGNHLLNAIKGNDIRGLTLPWDGVGAELPAIGNKRAGHIGRQN